MLNPRFVVADETSEGAVQEYPARRATLVRPSTRISPRNPQVTYIWPDLDLPTGQMDTLRLRAARIGYLGCSDSPVRVSVQGVEPAIDEARVWRPNDKGAWIFPVPYQGFTHALDAAYEGWLRGPMRRAWLKTERARYAAPGELNETQSRPVVFWLRFDEAIPGRMVLHVTQTLRSAVLDLYQRQLPEGEEVPAVLHGHGIQGRGYQHAQWLALPDVGFHYSSGRIHGAAVRLPPDTSSDTIARVRSALSGLSQLTSPGHFSLRVTTHGGEAHPRAASPVRWSARSRRWASAYPVVHERWSSRGPDIAEIDRWLDHAGFECHVTWAKSSPVPLLTGLPRLRPEEVHRTDRDHHPCSFFELELDRPIQGPLVLGRGRQFGLGLMVPRNTDGDD